MYMYLDIENDFVYAYVQICCESSYEIDECKWINGCFLQYIKLSDLKNKLKVLYVSFCSYLPMFTFSGHVRALHEK